MTLHTPSFDRDIDWSFDVQDADVLFRLPAIARHKIKVFRNDTCLQSVSEDYAFDKDRLKAFLAFLFSENCGDGLMFHGPFGCGKTSFVREVLGRLRWPTLMLSWNETSDTADLIGKTGISFGNTIFEPGPLTIAVTKGFVLVVNEIDRGRAGNLVALNDLLDGGTLVIEETGEVITPHPNFRLICTANSAGSGDLTGTFVGSVRKLDPAFLDRFAMLEVGYLTVEQERDMMLLRHPDYFQSSAAFVERMCAFAAETRLKAQDYAADFRTPLSTRALSRFFRYGRAMNLVAKIQGNARDLTTILPALELAYLNRLTPEENEVARVALKMTLGA